MIPSTVVGSLQCPDEALHEEVVRLVVSRQNGQTIDEHHFEDTIRAAVVRIVQEEISVGLDGISDGGTGQSSFMDYVSDGRLAGIRRSGPEGNWTPPDLLRHPEIIKASYEASVPHFLGIELTGPIAYQDLDPLQRNIERFRAALEEHVGEYQYAFMCAVSPGVLADQLWSWEKPNDFYQSYNELLQACSQAMAMEYREIVRAGFVLQVDAPDLMMNGQYLPPDGIVGYRRSLRERIDAINFALAGLAGEHIRVHVCSGNWLGTHEYDLALGHVLDLLITLPGALSIEGANPTHADEWEAFQSISWPTNKPLLYGIIDTKNVQYETPRLVSQRLTRIAGIIGKENVWACTDCGLHSFAGRNVLSPTMSWAKIRLLVQGAQLASQQLWQPAKLS